MERRVTLYGEPVLREPGKPVVVFDAALRELARDMVETMYREEGIGLAAQQVGLALRFCVVDLQYGRKAADFAFTLDGKVLPLDLIMPLALANPVVTPLPGPEAPYEEGCLSFPEVRGEIWRPSTISVRFHDLDGNPHELVTGGLLARVIQHEVDHLDGKLFIDRMAEPVRKACEAGVKRVQREGEKLARLAAK